MLPFKCGTTFFNFLAPLRLLSVSSQLMLVMKALKSHFKILTSNMYWLFVEGLLPLLEDSIHMQLIFANLFKSSIWEVLAPPLGTSQTYLGTTPKCPLSDRICINMDMVLSQHLEDVYPDQIQKVGKNNYGILNKRIPN